MAVRPSRRSRDGFVVATFSPSDTKEDCREYVVERLDYFVPTLGDDTSETKPDSAATARPVKRDTFGYAKQLWTEAKDADRSLIRAYLASRAITDITLPEDVRQHPGVSQGNRTWPAMLALIRRSDTDEPIGLHATFLSADGRKAPIEPNRRIYGSYKGGIVKLQPLNGSELMLSEGIESGLADIVLRRTRPNLTSVATWSAIAAGNLSAISLPSTIRTVRVLSDGDRAAAAAIDSAFLRWTREGRETRIISFGDGIDANDYLMTQLERTGAA